MKTLLAAGAIALSSTAAMACDSFAMDGGDWANVVQVGDTNMYHVMITKGFGYPSSEGNAVSTAMDALDIVCGVSGEVNVDDLYDHGFIYAGYVTVGDS